MIKVVAIAGLGSVRLPLAVEFGQKFETVGLRGRGVLIDAQSTFGRNVIIEEGFRTCRL